jgi:uncharacterized membrane protein SirB2
MLAAYVPLLILHMSLAVTSPVLFSVRAWRSIRGLDPARRWLKVTPHVVDTFLLLAGLGLAAMIRQYPFVNGWLTAKVIALVAYIGVGHAAVRRARSRGTKVAAWLAGLAIVFYIYGVAVTKDPSVGLHP